MRANTSFRAGTERPRVNLPKPRELPGAPSPNISETRRGIPALPRRQPYSYSSATADPSRSVEVSATIETSATSTNLNCRLQGKSLIESGLRGKSRISIEKRAYRHQLQNCRPLGSYLSERPKEDTWLLISMTQRTSHCPSDSVNVEESLRSWSSCRFGPQKKR
jgi:hypothetical protein